MPTLPPPNPAIPRCPRCRAKDLIKKGMCRTRHEARQRWGCYACGRSVITQITQDSCSPVTLMPETLWHLAAVVPSLRPQDLLDDADEEGQASYRSSPDCGGGSATDHHTCPITVEGLDAVVCARDPSPSRTCGV